MRYLVLASDYDGTLAHYGQVDAATRDALERLLATGRRLVLVTGREIADLVTVFPAMTLFEWVVAENGAILYHPGRREEKALWPAPPEALIRELRRRGVEPLAIGKVIVATLQPHEVTVLEVIRDLGLEYQIIFNKGAVMALPGGINKATGLAAALKEMGVSPGQVVGVGDAENDHALLQMCGCAVAVANALPALKNVADFTTLGAGGTGVCEVIDELIKDDLCQREGVLKHRQIVAGGDGPHMPS